MPAHSCVALAAGEFRSDLDPEQTARDLLMSAHGAVVRQLVLNDASAREQAKTTIDSILKGLSAPRKANGGRS